MFKEKYGINPKYLVLWFSLYLMTIIPSYIILYKVVPLYWILIIIIENIMSYYLLEDEVVDLLVEEISGGMAALFISSLVIALITIGWLMFNDFKLFAILLVIEVISSGITMGIHKYKSKKN